MSDDPLPDGLTRRDFARLAGATAGALSLPAAATSSSAADLTSSKMTERYEFVVNNTEDDYDVATLIEFSSTVGFTELDALGIEYRKTTKPKPAAHAHLTNAQVADVLDIAAAERLSHSPGSNPFWRLGEYPLGVFPEPRESTGYIDYEQMVDGLRHLESQHPSRLRFYSIGESPGHYNWITGEDDPKDVYVAEVTNDVTDEASFQAKEKVMFSLSLHGLERAGAEAGSRFIEDLLKGEEPEIEALLDDLVLVFVYPNPDGWVAKHPQYESGWQLLGPAGGAPVLPFYERGNAEVFDTNRQFPSVGWIDPAHHPGEPLGANLTDDEPGIDSDVPTEIMNHVPDALSAVEHFRGYENLNYGADLHGMLWTSDFILGLISQHQFDHGALHELYEMNRVIDDTVEEQLTAWNTLADVQQRVTGEMNPQVLGFDTLPEEAFDYSAIWDTIGYTVTGAMGDWMAHPTELGGLGMTTMDFEMGYSHMVGANVYDPELVRMQVDGYVTAIRTLARYAMRQTDATIETGGKTTAYVTTDALTRSSDELSFRLYPDKGFVEMNAGESFSGTIGPGTPSDRAQKRHTFTAAADADKIEATLSWSPIGQDLEFYLENADGVRLASSQTAGNPEEIAAQVDPGAEYTFVVETWVNAAADYQIDATYLDYRETETTRDTSSSSVLPGPNDTEEVYRQVRADVDELSISVDSQPGTVHSYVVRNPNGTVHSSFDPTVDAADGFTGMESVTVLDPEPGEWSVEVTNLMDAKQGEATVTFGTLASQDKHPDPKDALGYEQRDYEVDPFVFFEDYAAFADAAVDPLTVADVKAGAHLDYDNLVVVHDDAITDTEYVTAIDDFVDAGGNLVLTDTGVRLLAPMDNQYATELASEHVHREYDYIAHLAEKYPGHELLEGTRPIQKELWKLAPLGYATGGEAPMNLVDRDAFDAAGGTIAGETHGKVALGSLTDGLHDGTGIHVVAGLLPPAKQTHLHPFGLLDYSVSFLGHTAFTNALGYQQNRYVDGDLVGTFGDTGSFSVDPSVTGSRDDDGDLFTAGQTNQVDLTIRGNAEVLVRDRMPADWTVVEGDPHTTYTDGDTRYVEFENSLEDGQRTYFAEAPDDLAETSTYEFGPIEYSLDGGENWNLIPETTDRNNVLAADTSL